jgi:hypothetical protein
VAPKLPGTIASPTGDTTAGKPTAITPSPAVTVRLACMYVVAANRIQKPFVQFVRATSDTDVPESERIEPAPHPPAAAKPPAAEISPQETKTHATITVEEPPAEEGHASAPAQPESALDASMQTRSVEHVH